VTERYFMLGSLGRSGDEKPRANADTGGLTLYQAVSFLSRA